MALGFKNNASNKIIAYTDTGTGSIKTTTLNTGGDIDTSKLVPDSEEADVVVELDSMATNDSAKVDYGSGPSSDVTGAQGTGYTQTGTVDYGASKVQTDEAVLDKKLTRDEQRMSPDFKGQSSSVTEEDYKVTGTNGSSSNTSTATPTASGMTPPAATGGVGSTTPGTTNLKASYGSEGAGVSYDVPDTGTGDAAAGISAGESANTFDSTSMVISPDGTMRFEDVDFDLSVFDSEGIDPNDVLGSLNEEDYQALIEGIKKYNSEQIAALEAMLKGSEGHEGIDSMLDRIRSFMIYEMSSKEDSDRAIEEQMQQQVQWYRDVGESTDIFEHGVTYDEFMEMEYQDQLEFLKKYDTQVQNLFEAKESNDAMYDELVAKNFGDIGENGLKTYDELLEFQTILEQQQSLINQQINNYYNANESAEYDYLAYRDDYKDSEVHVPTEEDLAELKKYGNTATDRGSYEAYGGFMTSYSFAKYHEDHPDINEFEFIIMLEKAHPNGDYQVSGISNLDELKAIAVVYEMMPDFAKTCNYLFDKDPSLVKDYLKKCEYEINNIRGQYEAQQFLDTLYEMDDEAKLKELCNYFNVSAEGLQDGILGFFEGLANAGDAFWALVNPNYDGNRTRSVLDYKKMYILQALMPNEAKEAAGLIVRTDPPWTSYEDAVNAGFPNIMNETEFAKRETEYGTYQEYLDSMREKYASKGAATYAPATASLIDFTKEYAKLHVGLNNVYEISQGIGNMLPIIAVSCFCPMALGAAGVEVSALPTAAAWTINHAGSILMGISAGGNAYHGAMVDGASFWRALTYGMASGSSEAITEWFFGGLPFVSNKGMATTWAKYFRSMGSEAFKEGFQGALDSLVLRHFILGEKIPENPEEWEEWLRGIGKQALYGAITAGIMNLPTVVSARIRVHNYKKYLSDMHISSEAEAAAIEQLRQQHPELKNLVDDDIRLQYGQDIVNGVLDAQAAQFHVDRNIAAVMLKLDTSDPTFAKNVLLTMINNGVDMEMAKFMVENGNVSLKVAEFMKESGVSDPKVAKIMVETGADFEVAKVMKETKASKGIAQIMVDQGITLDEANQIRSSKIQALSDSAGVSLEAATIMFDEGVDANIAEMALKVKESGGSADVKIADALLRLNLDASDQNVKMAKKYVQAMKAFGLGLDDAKTLVDNGLTPRMLNLMKSSGVSAEIAKIMINNGVDQKIADYMLKYNCSKAEAKLMREEGLSLDEAKEKLVQMRKAELDSFMSKNGVSDPEIAKRMLEDGVTEGVAKVMVEKQIDNPEVARIVFETGAEVDVAQVMVGLNVDSDKAASILEKVGTLESSADQVSYLNGLSGEDILDVMSALNATGKVNVLNGLLNFDAVNQPYMQNLTSAILGPALDYYEAAAKLVADDGKTYRNFLTYRNHCKEHVTEVAYKALQSMFDIQQALLGTYEVDPATGEKTRVSISGFSSDINMYECLIAGLWHDTGMSAAIDGLYGLDSIISDAEIDTQMLIETKGGNITRSNHSFNSAMTVLMNSEAIANLGVDPNMVALLCFSHSKSNSGVSVLNSAENWAVCINKINNAVNYYNSVNVGSEIRFANTGGTNFIESLVQSGILQGVDSSGEAVESSKSGSFRYDTYIFNPKKLEQLASEAYALRLGDANTNNRNIGTNQAGQTIDISSMQGSPSVFFTVEPGTFSDVHALVISEMTGLSLTEVKRRMELPESDPDHIELFGSPTGITMEIGGETKTLDSGSLAYILGENNIEFSTRTDADTGRLVECFEILDPTQVPAATLFNIQERLGEVDTARNGGFTTNIEIVLDGTGIDAAQRAQIETYYDAFMKTTNYGKSFTIKWK